MCNQFLSQFLSIISQEPFVSYTLGWRHFPRIKTKQNLELFPNNVSLPEHSGIKDFPRLQLVINDDHCIICTYSMSSCTINILSICTETVQLLYCPFESFGACSLLRSVYFLRLIQLYNHTRDYKRIVDLFVTKSCPKSD